MKFHKKYVLLILLIMLASLFCNSKKNQEKAVNFYKKTIVTLETSLKQLKASQNNLVKSVEALKKSQKTLDQISKDEEKMIKKLLPAPDSKIQKQQNIIRKLITDIKTISNKIKSKFSKYIYFKKEMAKK